MYQVRYRKVWYGSRVFNKYFMSAVPQFYRFTRRVRYFNFLYMFSRVHRPYQRRGVYGMRKRHIQTDARHRSMYPVYCEVLFEYHKCREQCSVPRVPGQYKFSGWFR